MISFTIGESPENCDLLYIALTAKDIYHLARGNRLQLKKSELQINMDISIVSEMTNDKIMQVLKSSGLLTEETIIKKE